VHSGLHPGANLITNEKDEPKKQEQDGNLNFRPHLGWWQGVDLGSGLRSDWPNRV
jgi:hypothetical protein